MCWIIDILTRLLFNCTFPLKTCDILLRSTRARLAFLTRFVLQHPASCGQFGQSDSQQTASMVLRLQGVCGLACLSTFTDMCLDR